MFDIGGSDDNDNDLLIRGMFEQRKYLCIILEQTLWSKFI